MSHSSPSDNLPIVTFFSDVRLIYVYQQLLVFIIILYIFFFEWQYDIYFHCILVKRYCKSSTIIINFRDHDIASIHDLLIDGYEILSDGCIFFTLRWIYAEWRGTFVNSHRGSSASIHTAHWLMCVKSERQVQVFSTRSYSHLTI